MEELIRSIIFTMDTISITGRHNMDKFLGCLSALESIANALHESSSTNARVEEVSTNGGQSNI